MEFLNPGTLWLLALGLVPVLLYLVRRRSRKVRVSTLVFFKTLAMEHQDSAWLRRLKRLLSLLMTLAILFLIVFALARLFLRNDGAEDYRTVVILLDRSASMSVKDGDGVTRLDAAKRILRTRLERVPEEVGVALVAYDERAEVVQPRTTRRRELLAHLDGITVRPVAGRSDTAVETARMVAGLVPPAIVWHFSDHLLDADLAGMEMRQANMALSEVSNAGITTVQLRGIPLQNGRYDVFTKVALNRSAPKEVEARMDVSVGGVPSQVRELTLKPGSEETITLRVSGTRGQMLRLSLSSADDALALDDEVSLPLPELRPIVAAWIRPDEAEDPYTRLALSSLQESGSFELLKGNPSAWPLSEAVDVVILDGWLPSEWPEGLPGIVINPPSFDGSPLAAKRLSSPIPYNEVRTENVDHPVLFRISSGRVSVTQTSLYEAAGSLNPLWFAGTDTILSAGELGGRRIVVMGFSPGLSEQLPLTASFPILMGNALFWCVEPAREIGQPRLYRTGELVQVSGDTITWTVREGRSWKARKLPLRSSLAEMDLIGSWKADGGETGGAALLSIAESDISAFSSENAGDTAYFEVESRSPSNFKIWILSSVLGLLLIESWLFHRYAVY